MHIKIELAGRDRIEMLTRLHLYKPGVPAIGQADTCLGIVTTERTFKALPSPGKLAYTEP